MQLGNLARSWRLDLRIAARRLRRTPGQTLLAVLSLGIAVGAFAAVGTIAFESLVRPLPLDGADRLVRVRQTDGTPNFQIGLSPATYFVWRDHNPVLEGLAAADGASVNLAREGASENVPAGQITSNFLDLLGVRPILGRAFRVEDQGPGAPRVALVGWTLWQNEFGGDPGILGRILRVDGLPTVVVGVMPRGFTHPYRAELWLPLVLSSDPSATGGSFYALGRLKPGVTAERAEASLSGLSRAWNEEHPQRGNALGAHVVTLREELSGGLRPALTALFVVAGLVLLMAGANLCCLLFIRLRGRRRELALRLALGARLADVRRPLLAESLLLTLLGGAVGMILCSAGLSSLLAWSPLAAGNWQSSLLEIMPPPAVHWPEFAGAGVFVFLLSTAVHLWPASRAARIDPQEALREARTTSSRRTRSIFSALVIAEVSGAMMVIVAAGITAETLWNRVQEDPGYRQEQLLSGDVNLTGLPRYSQGIARAEFAHRVRERLEALPGVSRVGVITTSPLDRGNWLARVAPEGKVPPNPPGYWLVNHHLVFPGALEAMGMPLLYGRYPSSEDRAGTPSVVVVSRSFARRMWGGESATGKRIERARGHEPLQTLTVVGVVEDVVETRDPNDGELAGSWYLPYEQHLDEPIMTLSFLLRTSSQPVENAKALRRAVREVDADVAAFDVAPMTQLADQSRTGERFSALVGGILGTMGLLLAAFGIYAVVSYASVERRLEFGVRLAIGSSPAQLVRRVFGESARLTAIGVGLGTSAVLIAGRLSRALLFNVASLNPWLIGLAAAVLGAAVLGATAGPALRAARVRPMVILKGE